MVRDIEGLGFNYYFKIMGTAFRYPTTTIVRKSNSPCPGQFGQTLLRRCPTAGVMIHLGPGVVFLDLISILQLDGCFREPTENNPRPASFEVGMQVLDTGESLSEELETPEKRWPDFNFFYVHVKKIDGAGEDGDFDRKVALIEEVDRHLPRLLELKPDVLIVTGDHSTPSALRSHSWHPVPVIFHSAYCRPDHVEYFGEHACTTSGLGPRFPAKDLMPPALANAGRLRKFGA
jgi:hypothetical protein